MTPAGREYGCGHELGHLERKRLACNDPQLERECNEFAVTIIAPKAAMFVSRAVFGYDVPEIACALGTSDLIVSLRWGVTMEEPVAVVLDRGGVRRSGPDLGAPDAVLRAIARSGGGDGLRAIRIRCGVMLIGPT
jgi:hypothetical protein